MSSPIKIRYYRLTNNCIGSIIYPQLRSSVDPNTIVWDGRHDSGLKWVLDVYQTKKVDLSGESVPQNTPFLLSADVVWGTDAWETAQVFLYDPQSNVIASGILTGTVDEDTMIYEGCTEYNQAAEDKRAEYRKKHPSVADQILSEVRRVAPGTKV